MSGAWSHDFGECGRDFVICGNKAAENLKKCIALKMWEKNIAGSTFPTGGIPAKSERLTESAKIGV